MIAVVIGKGLIYLDFYISNIDVILIFFLYTSKYSFQIFMNILKYYISGIEVSYFTSNFQKIKFNISKSLVYVNFQKKSSLSLCLNNLHSYAHAS